MRRLGLSPPPPVTWRSDSDVSGGEAGEDEARRGEAGDEEDAPAMSLLDAGSRRKLVEGFTTMLITRGAR